MRISKLGKVLVILIVFGALFCPISLPQVFAAHTSGASSTRTYSMGSATVDYTFHVACTSGDNITEVNITVPEGAGGRYVVGSGTILDPVGWSHSVYPNASTIVNIVWTATATQYEIRSGYYKDFGFEAQAPSPLSDTSYNWTVNTLDNLMGTWSYDVETWVDVTAPTITLVSPAEDTDIVGMTTIRLDVSDLISGVSSVQWQWIRGTGYDAPIDPEDIGPWEDATESGSLWYFQFNGTAFATGFYSFRIRAYDAAGNSVIRTISYRNVLELPVWVFPAAIMVSLMLVAVAVMSYYRMKRRRREKRIRELDELLKPD